MQTSKNISFLRSKLKASLSKVFNDEKAKNHELNVFDNIVSRRQFISGSSKFAALSALTMSGIVPSAWATVNGNKHFASSSGVSHPDYATYGSNAVFNQKANGFLADSELFRDNFYSEKVTLADSHALNHTAIEGFSYGRAKLQAVFEEDEPIEAGFYDKNRLTGPTEALTVTSKSGGGWELHHFRHPYPGETVKTTLANTDGLIDEVIATGNETINISSGVPTKLFSMSDVNEVWQQGGQTLSNGRQLCLLTCAQSYPLPRLSECYVMTKWYDDCVVKPSGTAPDNFGSWNTACLSDLLPQFSSDTVFARNISVYHDINEIPHMIIYLEDVTGPKITGYMAVISFSNAENRIQTVVVSTEKASNSGIPSVTHLDWDWDKQTLDIVIAGDIENVGISSSYRAKSQISQGSTSSGNLTNIIYQHKTPDTQFNYTPTKYTDTSHIYDMEVIAPSGTNTRMILKAGLVSQEPYFFMMYEVKEGHFSVAGQFPFVFPEGISEQFSDQSVTIEQFVGGKSKYGGWRFITLDNKNNLTIFRQQRQAVPSDASNPYTPPVSIVNAQNPDSLPELLPLAQEILKEGSLNYSHFYNNFLDSKAQIPSWAAMASQWLNALVLNATAAFIGDFQIKGKDNYVIGSWLGNQYDYVYGTYHFSHDMEFIELRQGERENTVNLVHIHNKALEKSWVEETIETQKVVAQGNGNQNAMYQCFHTSFTPVNANGIPISLHSSANQTIYIEIRADSPIKIIDEATNELHCIDRAQSAMLKGYFHNGKVCIKTKAKDAGHMLYVRLVDSSTLSATSYDSATLSGNNSAINGAWQSLNMGVSAQQRLNSTVCSKANVTKYRTQAGIRYRGKFNNNQGNTDGAYSTLLTKQGEAFTKVPGTINQTQSSQSQLSNQPKNYATTQEILEQGYSSTALGCGSPLIALIFNQSVNSDLQSTPSGFVVSLSPDAELGANTVSFNSFSTPSQSGSMLGSIFSWIDHIVHDLLKLVARIENVVKEGLELCVEGAFYELVLAADLMKLLGINSAYQFLIKTHNEVIDGFNHLISILVDIAFGPLEIMLHLLDLLCNLGDFISFYESTKTLFTDSQSGLLTSGSSANPLIEKLPATWNDISNDPMTSAMNSAMNSLKISKTSSYSGSGNLPTNNNKAGDTSHPAQFSNSFAMKLFNKLMSFVAQVSEEFMPFKFIDKPVDGTNYYAPGILAKSSINIGEELVNDLLTDVVDNISHPKLMMENVGNIFDDVFSSVVDFDTLKLGNLISGGMQGDFTKNPCTRQFVVRILTKRR